MVGEPDLSASQAGGATEPTPASESSSAAPEGEAVTVGEGLAGEGNTTAEAPAGGEGGNATTGEGEPNAVTAANVDESQGTNESFVTEQPIVVAPSEGNATNANGETVEGVTGAPSGNETAAAGEGEGESTTQSTESENVTVEPQSEGNVTVEAGNAEGANGTAVGSAIDATPSSVDKGEESSSISPEGMEGAENATESSAGTSSDLLTPHGLFLSHHF